MSPQRNRSLPLAGALLVMVVGCDDGTSPGELAGLDPAALNGVLTQLVRPLSASAEVTENLLLAYPDLDEAGLEFDRRGVAVRLPAASRFAPTPGSWTGPLAVTIPEEIEGAAFVYDLEVSGWVAAEGRTDAPEDGVRVDWYQLDATGGVRVPLTTRGYADLTPGELNGMEALRVRAAATAGEGEVELLDFLQAVALTGGAQWSELILLDGTYSDADDEVVFSVFSDASGDEDLGTEEYEFEGVLETGPLRYELVADGSQAEAGSYEDRVRATAVLDGVSTVLDLTFAGDDEGEDVTGTLTHGGELLANVSSSGNRYTFTQPDGGEFSPGQTTELNDLFRSMLLVGFQPLLNLPLHFL